MFGLHPALGLPVVDVTLHQARPVDLDAVTLYRILQLRVEVFVVEQQCPYPELDGRDLEPDALWIWATPAGVAGPIGAGEVLATLRVLRESDGTARIGRVATAVAGRSGGVASGLMQHALAAVEAAGAPGTVLDAQSHLVGWYARFGFTVSGAEFIEDGIAHRPMRRT